MSSRKVIASLTTLGKVVDPFIQPLVGQQAGGLGPKLRSKLRIYQSNRETKSAVAKAGRLFPGFQTRKFEMEAMEDFKRFFQAHLKGDVSTLKDLLTEPYYTAVRRGTEDTIARFGVRRSAEIVEVLEGSQVVQGRLCYMAPAPTRQYFAQPDFIQFMIRTVTVQTLAEARVASAKGRKHVHARLDDNGEWRAAFAPSGHVYYYHTTTGAVAWEQPANYGQVGHLPVHVEQLGEVREPLAYEGANGEVPGAVRVVNYSVMERPVGVESARWRFAKV